MGSRQPELAEPISFRFFKDRKKNVIAVTLQTFRPPRGNSINVVDVRLFAMNRQGSNVPTPRGVTMSVNRLVDLHEAVTKALKKAQDLGLLNGDEDGE